MSSSETPPGGPSEPNDPESLVGSLVADRFRLSGLSSAGANTAIYVARDEQTGRSVTLKLLRPELTAAPSFRSAFDEAMRGVAALSHPNIAAVYDWGIVPVGDTSTAYVVIEHLTGGSLRDLFDRGRRLSPSQALALGLDACRALDHAHRRGFVHTELTPSKLVFGDDRRLRIVDFGLARLLGAPQWEHPESVDNHVAWYAAPELGLQRPLDGRADVYSLCLTLHEAVTGTLPFKSDSTVASLAGRVGKLMPVSADLGPLASVFERAGRPEADERSTAAEFGKGLVQAASKLPRPEPLPLLSSGLFDTPVEHLRSPDDPTGGVTRPEAEVLVVPLDEPISDEPVENAVDDAVHDAVDDAPRTAGPGPTIVDAEGADEIPTAAAGDDLVILPLDTGVRDPLVDPTAETAPVPAEPAPAAVVTRPVPVTSPEPARRRRGFPWKITIGVVLAAALVVLGVLATRLFATPVYTVPDLVGMPRAEALNQIAPNDWIVEEAVEASDVVPLVDHVVRTAPPAGSELAEGEPFLIVVSTGPVPRELPESTGETLADAQTRLIDRDLQVSVVEAFDEVVAVGSVVSWSVPTDPTLTAGSTVPPETLVELVVSRGPAPRVVPDVVGGPGAAARAAVEALQLVFAEGPQEFNDDVPLGTVIRQDPAPGVEVERGATVTVVISKGVDLVQFPDLSGAATYEDAAAILLEAGFEPRLRFGDAQGAIRDVTIAGEEPEVGETFRRATVVDISAL
ncbi:MAG TPA: PASTA domain-containing protein [Ilumatobacter sp.]|nr:PASTA domain-containing protein [Ilumatobacter sp.]